MSEVYVKSLRVPCTPRNKRNYNGIGGNSFSSVSTGGITAPPIRIIPSIPIPFTASALPTITDYNTLYATDYGQYPTVLLIIDNGDGTRYQRQQMPLFTTLTIGGGLDDLIDTIYFDLGEELTGWIILKT